MTSFFSLYKNYRAMYLLWRLNGIGFFTASVNYVSLLLVLCIFPLEKEPFVKLRTNFFYYYPQVKRNNPRLLDPLRVVIQTVFLIIFRQSRAEQSNLGKLIDRILYLIGAVTSRPLSWLNDKISNTVNRNKDHPVFLSRKKRLMFLIFLILSMGGSVLAITQPLDVRYQFIFVLMMWFLAIILKSMRTRLSLMLLIVITIIIGTRYIYWRITATLALFDFSSAFCSITLLLAELYTYTVMLLSYFQVSWILERKPYPMPKDVSLWPSVDLFIPTYNEPLSVVKPCILAATDIDYPKDKLRIYILDDGNRDDFRDFCKEIGIGYIRRTEHNHAKAGNINHALLETSGELIAIFDCDHIPTRAFLQMTVGTMIHDPSIALVQTPHHFYSEDPFEKNLSLKGRIPHENSLFHDFIQNGNDTWNATMFCGSCALIRRAPLVEIGGIAVETVTEDAHTSLRLCKKGYSSAFINIPLAAGLATESLADHINQRIRWARGMVQIFRLDNPLLGKGLTLPQRICYTNAMIHFLHGLPRIIFLLAPLPFLFFNIYVIFATGLAILSYVLPYMVHTNMTNQRIQGNKRFYFWGVVYETILSWYIMVPTLVALVTPHHGKFNITQKGQQTALTHFDWTVSKPYVLFILLNFAGFIYGLYRIFFDPFAEISALVINLVWVSYNLLILGAASAVALEVKQVRSAPRVQCHMDAILTIDENQHIMVTISDFSKDGLGLILPELHDEKRMARLQQTFYDGKEVIITIKQDGLVYPFKGKVKFSGHNKLGILLHFENLQKEVEYIRCTFAVADRYAHSYDNLKQDSLIHGIHTLVVFGLNGYLSMIKNTPHVLKEMLFVLIHGMLFVISMLPQPLDLSYKNLKKDKNQ